MVSRMTVENKRIILPCRLAPGDVLGVIAPASPFDSSKYRRGADVLKSMGFEIYEPPGLFSRKGYLAGADRRRAQMVEEVFAASEVDAIICARGGYGCLRVLDKIDFGIVQKSPKIFVGFSDATALLNSIYNRCGVATFHGPTLTCLGESDRKTKESLFSALTSNVPVSMVAEGGTSIKPGTVSGPVAGGNLTTLCHLTGLSFAPCFDEHIVFLEDRGEAPYRIDRMLTQMKMAGMFDRIKGLVLGDFSGCGGKEAVCRVFAEQFEGWDIPILTGVRAGHENINLTMPFGVEAVLDADEKNLRFIGPATVPKEKRACRALAEGDSFQRVSRPEATSPKCLHDPLENVDRAMKGAVEDFVFPGAVLLVSQGKSVLFNEAYGIRNVVSSDPVTRKTVFDLASLTKPLATTISLMVLADAGLIDVEDRLEKVLPGFQHSDKGRIRLRHLLCHTSGLPDYRPYYKELAGYPLEERKKRLRKLLVREAPLFPSEERNLYSDLGFMILSWVVERVSGLGLDIFVKERIFDPLDLNDLFFQSENGKKRKADYAATEKCLWRKKILEGEVHDENAAVVGGVEGHAGLFGTADNLHRLVRHLAKIYRNPSFDGLLSSSVVRSFLRRQDVSARAMGFDVPSPEGSSSGRFFSFQTVGHLGFTGTSFWMDLDKDVIVVLLSNRVHPVRENEKIRAFRPLLHDEIMKALRKQKA